MQQEVLNGFRLSPQQKRLWLSQQAGQPHCAQLSILIEGLLDKEALNETVRQLSARHEILRTGFECLPGMRWPVQVIAEQTALPFNEVCLDSASDDFIAQLCEEERDFLIDGQADLTG